METKKYLMDRGLAQVNLRLPTEMLTDFKALCLARDTTLSQAVRALIRLELQAADMKVAP